MRSVLAVRVVKIRSSFIAFYFLPYLPSIKVNSGILDSLGFMLVLDRTKFHSSLSKAALMILQSYRH